MVSTKIVEIRDSNFELLRIISMFMIVILHIGTHGLLSYASEPFFMSDYNTVIYYFIRSLAIISVPLYVMISGYYSSISKFKLTKLVKLFFEVSFFSTVMYLINTSLGYADFNVLNLLKFLFSVFSGEYWFVTVYFVMYALSPFLNKLIDFLTQKEFFNMLMLLFFISCIWQFIDQNELIGISNGYGIGYFLFLYFLAAYIQRNGFLVKEFKTSTYMFVYLAMAIFNSVIYLIIGISSFYSYNSPLVLIMAYCVFQYFRSLKIKSRKINYISRYVFGVYLIHEQSIVRQTLWGEFGIIEDILASEINLMILKMIGYSIVIFVGCWISSIVLSRAFDILYKTANSILWQNKSLKRFLSQKVN